LEAECQLDWRVLFRTKPEICRQGAVAYNIRKHASSVHGFLLHDSML